MIAAWTADRRNDLFDAANRAEAAYTNEPMVSACREYATALRAAANVLDEHMRVFAAVAPTDAACPGHATAKAEETT